MLYIVFTGGILLSAIFSYMQVYFAPQQLLGGMFSADHYSYAARVILCSVMAVSSISFFGKKSQTYEFTLITVSFIGALLAVTASNVFMMFISLQVMVIPLYLLIYYEIKPAIKYFIFSSLFIAVMLYGITLLYGLTGTGEYTMISNYLSFNPVNTLILILSVILIISGLAFTSLLAPFNLSFPLLSKKLKTGHFVQFSLINVIAVLFIIGRLIFTVLKDHNTFVSSAEHITFINGVNWKLLLAVISVCSIIAGNLVILWQYDLKKIAVYIIISQAGYLLLGIISGSAAGLSAFVSSMVVFAINSLGIIFCINLINTRYNVTETAGLKSLGKNDKFLFLAFIFFLVSSAGFPLTAGFNSKLILYSLPNLENYFWLIAAGIVSSVVFLFFIFRLSLVIFTGQNTQNSSKIGTQPVIVLLILLFPIVLFGIFVSPLLEWANYCSNLFGI
ncbi:MAG: hypothetical protein HOP31_05740 [Ignavibacteria bacterium]|nr:hypothetical protein [Ignavibacteria bacterium]